MIRWLLLQRIKKNRDPRWEDEFQFIAEEPPTNDKLHVEVVSTSSRTLLHQKVLNSQQLYFSVISNMIMPFRK